MAKIQRRNFLALIVAAIIQPRKVSLIYFGPVSYRMLDGRTYYACGRWVIAENFKTKKRS